MRAESLAERINADVVVYGVIERNGDALYLTPEFYVGIENFYEAEEMVGQYVLGESILILEVFDNLPSQIRLYRELTNRSQILAFITRGLTYYFIHACSHAGWSDNVSV